MRTRNLIMDYQEKVQFMKNCPYCHLNDVNETTAVYHDSSNALYIYPNGVLEMDYEDDRKPSAMFSEPGAIRYCPMCGRSLMEDNV